MSYGGAKVCTLAFFIVAAVAAGPPAPRPARSGSIPPGDLSKFARDVENSSVPSIHHGETGPAVVRAQILLDRARFSPGQIDGTYGDDLAVAVKAYREAHQLSSSGEIDAEMWRLLDADQRPLLTQYTIAAVDLKGDRKSVV